MDGDRFGGLLGSIGDEPQRHGGWAAQQGAGSGGHPPAPGPHGYPQQPPQGYPPQPPQGYPGAQGAPQGYPQPQGWDLPDARGTYETGPDVGRAGGGGSPVGGGPDGGGRRGGPSVTVVVATLGITALVAVLVGGLFGLLRPAGDDDVTAVASSPSASASADASAEPDPTGEPGEEPSASPTPTPRDTDYVVEPWAEGLDFGFLKSVKRSGGTVSVVMDRATFLTGKDAEKYYADNPELEPLDYAITNTNPRLRTFALTEDAVVYAQFALGDGAAPSTTPLDVDEFYDKASQILADGGELLLWLRHDPDPDGPVWYVAEQYTP